MHFKYYADREIVRVWRQDWPVERFVRMTHFEFAIFRSTCDRFEIKLIVGVI